MTDHLPLFDSVAATRLRDEGIAQAMDNKASLVKHVREWAKELGRRKTFVTADDVQAEIVRRGISVRAMGNSMGGIFLTKDWEATGRYVKSKRAHSHGNLLTQWRYIGD